MNYLTLSVSAVLFVFLSACSEKSTEHHHTEHFRAFAAKFKTLNLPCTLYAGSYSEYNLESSLPDTVDSLFVNKEVGYASFLGKLPDTSNFYSLIMLYPSDDMVPALVTYTRDGVKIDEKVIIARGCPSGEEIIYCESRVIIDRDLNLFLRDSLVFCDKEKLLKNDSAGCYSEVLTQPGKLDEKGKIFLSDEMKRKVKI